MLCFVKQKQNKFLKDEKSMSDSEYSEHKLEISFDENEDNKIYNIDELFKGIGLESYKFEPTNIFLINNW